MKIAVVQMQVRPGHRSSTLQAALAAIDLAAEAEPAPELIVLPAFGDVPHLLGGSSLPGERIEGPTVAACSFHARAWGVWLAFGFAERGTEKPWSTSVLLDVDGDVRGTNRQVKFGAAGRARFAAGDTFATFATPLGGIALLPGEDVFDESAWKAVSEQGAALIVSTCCLPREARSPVVDPEAARRRLCGLAADLKIACATADVATAEGARPDCAGFTTIIDAAGKLVASAHGRQTELLSARIAVATPTGAG